MLRTKKNVLILYSRSARDAVEPLRICGEVAMELKGQATLAHIDCSGEGKKLCKKLKVIPDATTLKHYKDGEFHKDYDRKLTSRVRLSIGCYSIIITGTCIVILFVKYCSAEKDTLFLM